MSARQLWVIGGLLLAALSAGCDGQAPTAVPAPSAGIGPPPPPPPPPPAALDPATQPGTSPAIPAPPPPGEVASPAGIGPAAFLAANRQVLQIHEEMRSLLAGAVDDATAQKLASELPPLVPRWEATSKGATALFLTLSKQQQGEVMQAAQREMFASGKPMGEDMLAAMQRLAASPQRPLVEGAILHLRDTMLAQHSIYAPVTFRQKLAEKLAAAGSPLP